MSKTMDAIKVHEFANNLWKIHFKMSEHMGIAGESRARGFKIQTIGNLRGKNKKLYV